MFFSEFNFLLPKHSFNAAEKSVGANGFSAVWTEILKPVSSSLSLPPSGAELSGIKNATSNQPSMQCIADTGVTIEQKQPGQTVVQGPGQTVVQMATPASHQLNHRKIFYCKKNNYCISSKLRCNQVANCGFGDDSDEAGCIFEVSVNLVDLFGGTTALAMFTLTTCVLVLVAVVLIVSLYRRFNGELKESPSQANQKCAVGGGKGGHHLPAPMCRPVGGGESDFNPFYATELNVASAVCTPAHRIIEVMTVSSGQLHKPASKWANMISTSAETNQFSDTVDFGADVDPSVSSSISNQTPIPPPPPPPAVSLNAAHRAMASNSRKSSLANFYGDPYCDSVDGSPSGVGDGNGSNTSIDRSYGGAAQVSHSTNASYRNRSTTLNRSQGASLNQPSHYSPATFTSFHTLGRHPSSLSNTSNHQYRHSLSHLRQHHSQSSTARMGDSRDSENILMNNLGSTSSAHPPSSGQTPFVNVGTNTNGTNGNAMNSTDDDEDDTDMSLRLAQVQQNSSLLNEPMDEVDMDMVMMMMDNHNNPVGGRSRAPYISKQYSTMQSGSSSLGGVVTPTGQYRMTIQSSGSYTTNESLLMDNN